MVKRQSSCCKTDENAIVTPTRPTRLLALFHSSWRYSSDAGRSKNCFFFSFFFTPPKFVANSRKFEKWPLPCQQKDGVSEIATSLCVSSGLGQTKETAAGGEGVDGEGTDLGFTLVIGVVSSTCAALPLCLLAC